MYNIDLIIIALRLYANRKKNNTKITDILSLTNICRSTFYRWMNTYYNNPNYYQYIYTSTSKLNTISDRPFNRLQYSKKVTDECIKYIIDHTLESKIINVRKMKKYIRIHFNILISKGYIYYLLKINNITFKKAQKNTYLYDTDKYADDKVRLQKEILAVNYNLNYTDETSISCGVKTDYGWSGKGKDCVIEQKNTYGNRGYIRFSCVMTMTKDKIINYRLRNGSYKGNNFKDYIKNTINKMGDSTPFMDNARIHKTVEIREYLKKHNKKIIFNVPYSPKFNPIEYVFNVLKCKLKRNAVTNLSSLRRFMRKFVSEINVNGLENYCNKSKNNLFN